MDIKLIIKELENIKRDLPKEAQKIAKKYKDTILDYIREKQLFEKGIDGKGRRLIDFEPYSPFTIVIKRQKGQPYDRVTLNDTGSFTDKMDLIFTDQNAIGFFSRDAKTPELIQRYGADIFTLTVDNRKEIDEKIFEVNLVEWVLKQIENKILK